jgi:hypothetical protein
MTERNNSVARRQPEAVQPVASAPAAVATMEMHALIPRMELARRLPRSPTAFLQRLGAEVLLDPGPMVYHKPGKDEDGQDIELVGPSVRMAEIAGRLFGNLDVSEPKIVEVEGEVTATVLAMDLETNYRAPGTASKSLVTRNGRRMPPFVVSNLRLAAASIAFRNAIEKIIGKHVLREMVQLCLAEQMKRAEAEMKKGGKEQWWAGELKTWAKFEITEADLFTALGVKSLAEVTPKHSAKLTGCMATIKQEQTTPRVALGLDAEPAADAPPPATNDEWITND